MSGLPSPITLADVAAAASEVAESARGLPVARKAQIVAVYLDAVLHRMSGDELYELRWQANLSQAEFAAHLGISQPSVSDMERGRRPVTTAAALLARMAAARASRA